MITGGDTLEQVNIEGKRSGDGFVAHKDSLVSALSRAQSERVTLSDEVVLGRKGFMGYLKALAGSNIIKVVPANGNASGVQVAEKGVKVVCGSHQSYLPNGAWIKEKTAHTYSLIHVSPSNAIMPNLGSVELAEALSKVLPFASTDEKRPILECIKVVQKDGKLTLTGCDTFSLSEVSLNFEEGEAEALIYHSDLKDLIPALRKAKRVKVSIEVKGSENGAIFDKSVVIDTEVIRYRLHCQEGNYPDYETLIPNDFTATASFDTKEVIKACKSLLTVWYKDGFKPVARPITLTIEEGMIRLQAQDERGEAVIPAETSGQGKVAIMGKRLLGALKACNGMVDMSIVDATTGVVFTVDSHRCLVMPMELPKPETEGQTKAEGEGKSSRRQRRRRAKAEAKTEAKGKGEGEGEGEREGEAVGVA